MAPFMRAIAVAAMLASGGCACAADFPSRPVRLLVPYAPGGGLDIVARSLGEPLARMWGQQLIIDNRPGAGGVIASTALAQSPLDGYTLMIMASGHR